MLGDQDTSAVPHLDLHTHILPGVDDGPESTEHSVELIAQSVRQGAVGIAATPHRSTWAYHEPIPAMEARLGSLRQACSDAGLDVELYMGGETFLVPDLVRPRETLDIVTLNRSRYLLFELPFNYYPPYVEEIVFELQLRGYKPVLAHAERYTHYHQDVNQIITLVERGVLAQINAGSLAGDHGTAERATAEIMLEHRMAHLVASDSHSVDARPPAVARNYDRLVELVGREAANKLVMGVPRMIVEDEDVPKVEPLAYQRRHFWQMWRVQA